MIVPFVAKSGNAADIAFSEIQTALSIDIGWDRQPSDEDQQEARAFIRTILTANGISMENRPVHDGGWIPDPTTRAAFIRKHSGGGQG